MRDPLTSARAGEAWTEPEKILASLPPEKQSFLFVDKPFCERLLASETLQGWEQLFVGECAKKTALTAKQKAKLQQIAEAVREREASERRCRHCNGRARVTSPSSYQCDRCGNCLNLQWGASHE